MKTLRILFQVLLSTMRIPETISATQMDKYFNVKFILKCHLIKQ